MANLDPSELLYRAFRQLCSQHKVSPADIPFPDMSVNRASLSTPQDLLVGREPSIGICSFLVRDIPSEYIGPHGEKYTFIAVEDPQPDNAAHAEIRVFIDGARSRVEPPKSIRRRFRVDLASGINIVVEPT